MLSEIGYILQHHCEIHSSDVLLVGVSGGPDSLCLMHVLHQLGYQVIAMHINHKLRSESENEVDVVKQITANLGIALITAVADVKNYVDEFSVSIEEAGRILRYRLLFEQAKNRGARAVVVGHNANDQVETILFHLLRGAGLNGLRGMDYRVIPNPWSGEISLVRPLLSTSRMDIQKYLDEQNLIPISDRSNLDVSFSRNRIRHELIPILENYNPSIREVILRMGQGIKDDYAVLQQLTEKAWDSILIEEGEGYLLFQTARFQDLHRSIQRYVLRRAMAQQLPGLKDVGFDCIERGINILVRNDSNDQTDLVAGLRLLKEGEQFWVATWRADLPLGDFPAIPINESLSISIPSSFGLNNGWQLSIEKILEFNLSKLDDDNKFDPFQVWLADDELELPLSIRTRRPGDDIKPFGLDGHTIKISDVMVNQKFPKRARRTWPLVCSGDEIVWLPGYRISHITRIRPDTKTAVHMKLSRVLTT